MANNVFVGEQILYAKTAIPFVMMGLNNNNINIIYKWELPNVTLSYKPGRTNNGITGTETGGFYLVNSKSDQDLTAYFDNMPSGGNGILLEDGSGVILPEDE